MKIVKKIRVTHPLGLHLRAGAKLISIVNRFHSEVTIQKENRQASGRSLLNLMTLGAVYGSELETVVEGDDAGEALAAIHDFFENGFGENIPTMAANGGFETTDPEGAA